MRLSVIIPAYNEEKRIAKTLKDIDQYLSRQNYSYEILVIDDGSKDKTREVAENLLSEIRNLKVITYKENQGKGYAVRAGFLQSKGKYRLFADADDSTSIDQIEKFLPELKKEFAIAIGSRDIKGAVLDPPQPCWRKSLGRFFALLRKLTLGLRQIEDTQCGFKCFKKEVVEQIFPKCKINGFAFDVEVLILSQKAGFKIKEIPVFWKNRSGSKVKPKAMLQMALDLLKIKAG